MLKREIVYLSKGLPKFKIYNGQEYRSGIWKEQTAEISVGLNQIPGDDVDNHVNHGGPDRVVCVYPFEHYAYWESEFGQPLVKSAFGENLTLLNMKEDQIYIGDIYQIGDAVLQVSQGRYPCATINMRNNNNFLLKRIFETGYTGYFFRVLEEGVIHSSSQIKQLLSHPKQVTVASVHHLYFHKSPTVEAVQQILDVDELADQWRKLLHELKEKITNGNGTRDCTDTHME